MDCIVFRASKKEDTYLYVRLVDDVADMQCVPEALITLLGELHEVIQLDLSAERKLANADVKEVMARLEAEGYFLQMPPNPLLRKDSSSLFDPSDGF